MKVPDKILLTPDFLSAALVTGIVAWGIIIVFSICFGAYICFKEADRLCTCGLDP